MANQPIRAAVVGCGNIAGSYFKDLQQHDCLTVVGCTDLELERAYDAAEKYGCQVYQTLDQLLAEPGIDLVINLTIHHAHYEVSRRCLEAGKHVFSEKPLALRYEQAQELVRLAEQQGVRLGGAPFTFMGAAQQTAWKLIRAGRLGQVRVAYAEVNWGRIESWHPAPAPFYDAGPLFDVGVYPLSILATIFGPVQQVSAYGRVLHASRVSKHGVPFEVQTPDFGVCMLEYASGPVVRLTTNFYVSQKSRQAGIEFHGDKASLYLSHWMLFNAEVAVADFDQPYEAVPLVKEPYQGVDWGRGVADMAEAILEGRPHRARGTMAAHVVEILSAASRSMQEDRPVALTSVFEQPEPMPWAQPDASENGR